MQVDASVRRFGESLSDDRLAAIVDNGGVDLAPGEAAKIAAELLARRAASHQHGSNNHA
jgi:hypothetical protein